MMPAPAFNPASERTMIEKYQARRRRLPTTRAALVHKFRIGDHEGYLRVGLFEDGTPGEIFIEMSKAGSTISGLMDGIAILASVAFQSGVPLSVLASKFEGQKFQPYGFTINPELPWADSVPDYVFRYLARKFSEPGRAKSGSADLLLPAVACAPAGQPSLLPAGSENSNPS